MTRLLATLLLLPALSFATNGGNVIGVGPRSISMGGTGLAHHNGPLDGTYKNPSLLTEKEGAGSVSIEAATTYLGLSVSGNAGGGVNESKATSKIIPDLAASYRIDDKMTLGLGILAYSGAAFDYSNITTMTGLKVEHTVFRFQPTFAMKPVENFSFGLSPILGYGELGINSSATGTQSADPKKSAMAFGGQVGANAKIESLTIGASYILPIKYKHEAVANVDLFGPNAANAAFIGNDDLSVQQPGEIGIGVGYQVIPEWTVTFDYRNIGWGSANIYENLGWRSQNVFAFGTQYKTGKISLRGGFNYAKSPVEDATGEVGTNTTTLDGHVVYLRSASLLNIIGFPPASQTHITVGGGYEVSDNFAFDLAFVLVPKTTLTRAGTAGGTAYSFTSDMSQWSITGGVKVGL